MALNERAEVLTSRELAAEDEPVVDAHESGDLATGGNGTSANDASEDATGGHERTATKRTARQRTLLVTGNGTDGAAPPVVDPLLASSPAVVEEDGVVPLIEPPGADGKDEEPDELDEPHEAAAAPSGRIAVQEAADLEDWADPSPTAAIEPMPPTDAVTSVAIPATVAGAAVTARFPVEPSPTSPMPLPRTILDRDGQTTLDDGPAPPVMVPPPPKPQRRTRPRVRKVTRVVRSVDAWSVFKVAAIFFVAMGVVIITAGVLLWNLAQSTGTLDNVEGFFREAFNYDTFKLQSDPLFHALLTLTVLFVVAGTGLAVVMAVLFNLIADLTGGIRVTVLEREVVARDDPRKTKRKARPPVGRTRRAPPPPPATPPVTG
jgi:hypothetical protein